MIKGAGKLVWKERISFTRLHRRVCPSIPVCSIVYTYLSAQVLRGVKSVVRHYTIV